MVVEKDRRNGCQKILYEPKAFIEGDLEMTCRSMRMKVTKGQCQALACMECINLHNVLPRMIMSKDWRGFVLRKARDQDVLLGAKAKCHWICCKSKLRSQARSL